jgi:hypothetical protein
MFSAFFPVPIASVLLPFNSDDALYSVTFVTHSRDDRSRRCYPVLKRQPMIRPTALTTAGRRGILI